MAKLSDYQKCLKRNKTKKPRTKAQFRKVQRKCRSKKKYSGKKGGKFHKTTRGLSQDQKRKSQEPHEKTYRKQKRKDKR